MRRSRYRVLVLALLSSFFTTCHVVGARELPQAASPSLPKQTPVKENDTDKNGIPTAIMDGKVVYRPLVVALQALYGVGRTKDAARDWLEKEATPIGDGALIWYYRFDNAYNDVEIKAPWASAFGQAYILGAFVKAYEETKDEKYRQFAIKAARAFSISIGEGGLHSRLGEDIFFEEIPALPASHILNGHMISTIYLIEAGRALGAPEIEQLGLRGVETLRKHLWKYDLGYWSRYDLNPRKFDIPVRLFPLDESSAAGFEIDKVEIIDPRTDEEVSLDVGGAEDATGWPRLGGTDWQQPTLRDKRTVRPMEFGPLRRREPVQGGTIQNTYFFLRLPSLARADFNGDENWLLRIDYFDAAPSRVLVQTQALDQGNFLKFRTLGDGLIETTGSKTWHTAYVPLTSKDLSWFMGPEYQEYNVPTLERLYQLTGDHVFDDYAKRWKVYLDQHSDRDAERNFWMAGRSPDGRAMPSGDQAPPVHIFKGDPAEISKFTMPVSIASAGGGDYLLSDYSDAFLFDRTTSSMKLLQIDMGDSRSTFSPASFAVDAPNDRVFIANYRGNNILIGRLDKARASLRIIGEIGDVNTISSEAVAFNGSLVATANYDGNNVQVFAPDGNKWSTRCNLPIKQAHGITFLGRYVYATSLTDRQIVKIDPDSCTEVGRAGSAGWGLGQYLWPTSVAPWDDKSIAITDAHTGLISIADAKTLSVNRQLGGNGPGLDGLNMPYGLFVESDNMLVTNTFRGQIAAFNKASGAVTEVWSDRPAWQGMAYNARYSLAAENRQDFYTRRDVSVTINGQCYHPAYGRLTKCDDATQSIFVGEADGGYLFMIETVPAERGVFAFSSSSLLAFYFEDGSDPEHPRKVFLGRDHWLVEGRVVGPDGTVDLTKLLKDEVAK